MSIRDLAALGVRKAQLNGGMYYNDESPGRGVDESTDTFNSMIAHLEVAIKDAPPWWDLDKIADVDLVSKLYQEVLKFENSFLVRGTAGNKGSGQSGEGNSTKNVAQADDAGGARQVVEQEVQAALEP
ncbi:hypothetical protein HC928_00405 [bacterium]|nr:hypothetical protein [bacterium]